MKSSVKKLLLVLVIMFAVGVTLMAAGFFAGASLSLYVDSSGIHVAERERGSAKIEEEIIQSLTKIELNVDMANIKIIGSDRNSLDITYSSVKPTYSVENGTLKVTARHERGFPVLNLGFFDFHRTNEIIIYCNAYTELDIINVDSDLGDVRIEGINASNVNLKLSAGKLTVKDVKAGILEIKNDLGDVNLNGMDVNDSKIKLSLGKIEANGDFGHVQIDNDLGDINFRTTKPREVYQTDFNVDLGKVTINGESPRSFNKADELDSFEEPYMLKIYASLGNINVKFGE